MIFVGIDLAADPRRTGLAILHEVEGAVDGTAASAPVLLELLDVRVGVDDDAIVDAISRARRVGVDVPLGWPDRFVELLARHVRGELPVPRTTGPTWRRGLAMRETDEEVHRRTGLTPLSVSTDRIAHPAMRWAGIEARLRDDGVDVARDGSGIICEVYPAAALRVWGLPHRGYKADKGAEPRRRLVEALARELPELSWGEHRGTCIADDNALDAVLAALVAREVEAGRAVPPGPGRSGAALREGWIWLPTSTRPGTHGTSDAS